MKAARDLREINAKIQLMQDAATELKRLGRGFPALDRNVARISASLKMLALNVTDIVELSE